MLSVYVIIFCSLWMVIEIYLLWSLHQIPQLSTQVTDLPEPDSWPSVSMIIPACNEAEHLESALRSLLELDYPHLEIIVINDRSTDATGSIIEQLAAEDPRIKALHISTLPANWLGKVHALDQGVKRARGSWLLFTDADVYFKPATLKKAIQYVQHENADHLALMPDVVVNSFWLDVAIRSFGLLFLWTTRAAQVHKSTNRYYVGVGAFNLVKRDMYDKTPGLEWLRLEPADDAAMGMMLKQAGARTRFAFAQTDLSVHWYPSLTAMFKGLEKNLFGPGAHYQWWRVVFQGLSACALVAAPGVGVLAGIYTMDWVVIVAAGVALTVHTAFASLLTKAQSGGFLSILLFPLGILLINAMMVHAAYRCLRNDGIDWRGTHYSLALLRAGQRLKF